MTLYTLASAEPTIYFRSQVPRLPARIAFNSETIIPLLRSDYCREIAISHAIRNSASVVGFGCDNGCSEQLPEYFDVFFKDGKIVKVVFSGPAGGWLVINRHHASNPLQGLELVS